MSNNQNLESLYNSELKPRLTELNNQRADIVNKIKNFFLLFELPSLLYLADNIILPYEPFLF